MSTDELDLRVRRELRAWAEENPLASSDELHEAVAAIAERLAPEGTGLSAELEERLWEEWGRIEEEREGRFGP